jgi:hypothetical protein
VVTWNSSVSLLRRGNCFSWIWSRSVVICPWYVYTYIDTYIRTCFSWAWSRSVVICPWYVCTYIDTYIRTCFSWAWSRSVVICPWYVYTYIDTYIRTYVLQLDLVKICCDMPSVRVYIHRYIHTYIRTSVGLGQDRLRYALVRVCEITCICICVCTCVYELTCMYLHRCVHRTCMHTSVEIFPDWLRYALGT